MSRSTLKAKVAGVKVAVFGSSGFIGSHVIDQLRAAGMETIGIDIKDPVWSIPDHGLSVDIRSRSLLKQALTAIRPHAVINSAGILGTSETFDRPSDTISVNMIGAVNSLLICKELEIPYIGIDTGTRWLNPYSITKHAATELSLAYNQAFGTPVTILKIFNAYGPRQNGVGPVSKIVPRFIYNAIHEMPLPVYGNGEQLVDMVWVKDCALAIARCLERVPGKGEIIEIGSGQPTSVNDVAHFIIDHIGRGSIEYLPPRRGEGSERGIADTRACRDTLGFLPEPTLRPLAETIVWYQEQTTFLSMRHK
jgi:UDP-glucose 4-epimerase